MLDKLQQVEERFETVNELICDPDIVSDMEKYRDLMPVSSLKTAAWSR